LEFGHDDAGKVMAQLKIKINQADFKKIDLSDEKTAAAALKQATELCAGSCFFFFSCFFEFC
jgi:hypothetical protein